MPYNKFQAAREFDRWSQGYDRCVLQRLLFAPSHRAIIARIGARSGDRPLAILDVGCGTGVFASRIRAAAPRSTVWGVDLVFAMLAQGKARWRSDPENVAAVQGDSERLPFRAGAFDVVTCANSFHHYPHQDRAVAEMYRVLKPGGRLFLVDGCRDGLWGWFIYDVCVAGVEGDVLHASARRVRNLFGLAGFVETNQKVYRGLAPFILTEGVTRSRDAKASLERRELRSLPERSRSDVKMLVAAVQMPSELLQIAANLERADSALGEASQAGSALAVLPEMFITGHGLLADFGPAAEGIDGPTLRHLSGRSRQWRMGIAAGFVERAHGHLYDALALCLPDGSIQIYRKRHLVFWERFRFLPGRSALIVPTPWGRIGLAICADMIYRNVWDGYRGQIDLGVIASAWPEFASRHSGRKHWLFGRLGPLSSEIPVKVARDLDIPVICVNQCGPTRTTIPILGLRITEQIDDRFAGRSSICDGRRAPAVIAGIGAQLVLSEVTVHNPRGVHSWRSTFPSVPEASFSGSA